MSFDVTWLAVVVACRRGGPFLRCDILYYSHSANYGDMRARQMDRVPNVTAGAITPCFRCFALQKRMSERASSSRHQKGERREHANRRFDLRAARAAP